MYGGRIRAATGGPLYVDRQGVLWIGTFGAGLNRLVGTAFSSYSAKDGLSAADVRCFFQDRKGDLWIGTGGGGLGRLSDGKLFTGYGAHEGLSSNTALPVFAIGKAMSGWAPTMV
jgi:ligand-binding sensor domain-containing protein